MLGQCDRRLLIPVWICILSGMGVETSLILLCRYCESSSAHCAASSCQKDHHTCTGGQTPVPGNTLSAVIIPSSSSNTQSIVTVTVSKAAPTCLTLTTVTLPGVQVTLTVPGAGEVITTTVLTTIAQPASTVKLPGEYVTITFTNDHHTSW
jgi:hypothetical protein